ncbi:MAG: DUF4105 domain-containing protein [Deltaproteobacteria bacterium]|nr:DUF4105 domain-containing protein [Deltaproteobacteria bacterium]
MTFGPGAAVAESFGHSAIRVTEGDDDRLYNLGHAEARGVAFFFRVAAGEAVFTGANGEASGELARYRAADRSIRRQALMLDEERARWLAEELRTEVGGRRFSYRYDYLRDNCTTEVRDLLDTATDGALRRQAERHDASAARAPTYRELIMAGFSGHFSTLLGSDLLTGPVQDVPLSGWDALYLPEPLHDRVAAVPGLARPSVLAYERRGPRVHGPHAHVGRLAVFLFSFVVALLLLAAAWKPHLRPFAGAGLLAVAPPIAMTGLGAWFLMATSTLPDLTWNENALVMWPTDLVLVAPALRWLHRRKAPRLLALRAYLGVRLIVIAGLVMAKLGGWAIQDNAVFIVSTVLVLAATVVALGRPQ